MNVSHLSDAQLQTDLIRARQLLQDAPSFLAQSKAAQQVEAVRNEMAKRAAAEYQRRFA